MAYENLRISGSSVGSHSNVKIHDSTRTYARKKFRLRSVALSSLHTVLLVIASNTETPASLFPKSTSITTSKKQKVLLFSL